VERKIYEKLIRDLIPEIIAEKGKKSKTSGLSDEKFIT
jgi:predicted house-cleaning noncanonical NTP pyrophosphatase (MazG superfamily)